MKKISFRILIFLMLLIVISCHHNRLKTNEKELAKEIKNQESEIKEAERIASENQVSDTLVKTHGGFFYKEDRSVDLKHPPVVIDFSKEIPVRKFKLSNIASKVRYLVLQVPDDSNYFSEVGVLDITLNNIITSNIFGIQRFSRDGKFIETICKNSFSGKNEIKFDNPLGSFFPIETFRGAIHGINTIGNKVFYKYSNYPEEKASLVRFSLKDNSQSLTLAQPVEAGQPDTFAKGEIISEGTESLSIPQPELIPVSDYCYASIIPKLKTLERNSLLMITFNLKGDTLCKFKQYDFLDVPITKTLNLGIPHLKWYYGQSSTFKWAFNDTIFRLIPPNRLVPAFIFNFGKYKTTDEDWFQFNIKMHEKLIPNEILEDARFLYIIYDYFPIEKNAKSKLEYALFDKSTNILFRLKFDDEQKNKLLDPLESMRNHWKAGFENDMDGGTPFWPRYITSDGNIAMTLQPELLKHFIQHSDYMSTNDPRKKAFATFVNSLKTGGRELVIMFAE
jgi:Domain of unknown function (DUF4933)